MVPFILTAKKSRKKRIKREVIDVPLSLSDVKDDMLGSLKVSTKAWAKIAPGSIKLVKRVGPVATA